MTNGENTSDSPGKRSRFVLLLARDGVIIDGDVEAYDPNDETQVDLEPAADYRDGRLNTAVVEVPYGADVMKIPKKDKA